MSIRFQHTRMRLVQCAWEGHWAECEPARMILADSTAVARQYKTRNRSRGSTWVHDQTKKINPISAHEGASCTTRMGLDDGRAIGPRLGLSGGSWLILPPWQDRSQHRFLQNQVPEKQLVWTCQAGPSTSRGLVTTWWSQTWHSLFRTRWARHGLHAPLGMQTRPLGLHMVLAVYTTNDVYVCT
jgi:hypothetical protein